MFELTISAGFEAAHRLPNYAGKCNRLHGHNWRVEVTVGGDKLDTIGMLVDFKVLRQAVDTVLQNLDHYYLNEKEPFCRINPTAENIAKYVFEQLRKDTTLPFDRITIRKVRVWESAKSMAEYREHD